MTEPPPELTVIVAMTRNLVIGHRGRTPWHLPEELQLFQRLTLGGTVIMGRRTFEAIGKPLPGRHNLVLSTTLDACEGIEVYTDFTDAVERGRQLGRPIFFIGGRQIYQRALAIADRMAVSWIAGDYAGDEYFPAFAADRWQVVSEEDFETFRLVRYLRLPQ